MNQIIKLKDILKNGGFFVLLLVFTFYFMFRNQNLHKIIRTAADVNPIYIVIAISCMGMFILCEAINIRRTLNIYKYHVPFYKCIKYAIAGFFFSAITPMATGGQPMQIYYMYKDNIQISHSALALMLELASYQFVTVSMAVLAFIIKFDFFNSIDYHIKYILITGVLLNTCILLAILMAFFSKKVLPKTVNMIFLILEKLHVQKIGQWRQKAAKQIMLYQKGAADLKRNKWAVFKIMFTTTVQIIAFHSIPYWVYKAFGFGDYSFVTVTALQAVLYITVSAIPLPGSVGASENGFLLIFRTLFPMQIINSAMLLSRGISFYLFLMISGVCLLTVHLINGGTHIRYHQFTNLK